MILKLINILYYLNNRKDYNQIKNKIELII